MRALLIAMMFAAPSAFATEVTLPKKVFVEQFTAGLPKSFCDSEKTYFRSCYSVSAEECAASATKAIGACMTELDAQLPAEFRQPVDGQYHGRALGICAGEKFEEERAAARKSSAECDDASKWQ